MTSILVSPVEHNSCHQTTYWILFLHLNSTDKVLDWHYLMIDKFCDLYHLLSDVHH